MTWGEMRRQPQSQTTQLHVYNNKLPVHVHSYHIISWTKLKDTRSTHKKSDI